MSSTESRPAWQRVVAKQDDAVVREASAPVYDIPEDRAHDSREEIEWFQKLPDHAKEEIRDAWRRQDGEHRRQKERRRETTHSYIYEGAAVFFLFQALIAGGSVLNWFLAAAVGAAAGLTTRMIRAGAMVYGLICGGYYVVFALVCTHLAPVMCVFAALIMTPIGMGLGRIHQLQKFDGTDL